MKRKLAILPILGSLLTAFSAHAATADLKVTGKFLPSSCKASFVGGNAIDFGVIRSDSLEQDWPTSVGFRTTTLNLECDAPTRVALKLLDNRAESVVPGLFGDMYMQTFGLGAHAGKNIGSFYIDFGPGGALLDGLQRNFLQSKDLAEWDTIRLPLYKPEPGDYISFGQNNSPSHFTSLNVVMGVAAAINKASELPIVEEFVLDGSVTVEILYI